MRVFSMLSLLSAVCAVAQAEGSRGDEDEKKKAELKAISTIMHLKQAAGGDGEGDGSGSEALESAIAEMAAEDTSGGLCPEEDQKSGLTALCLELFFTPIAEWFYLGYHVGAQFALLVSVLFGVYFCCVHKMGNYVGGKLPEARDPAKWAATLNTCGSVVFVFFVIFCVSCGMWLVIDFLKIVTNSMEDASGCPIKEL